MAGTAHDMTTLAMEPGRWYSREEIKQAYQISNRTVTRWVNSGRLEKKAAVDNSFVYRLVDTEVDKIEESRLLQRIAADSGAAREQLDEERRTLATRVQDLSEINAGLSVQLRQARDDASSRLKALEDKSQEAETLKAKAEQADKLEKELDAVRTRKRELFAELAKLPWFKRKRRRALLFEIAGL